MHLEDIIARARYIRSLYEEYERENYGREWSTAEIVLGTHGGPWGFGETDSSPFRYPGDTTRAKKLKQN